MKKILLGGIAIVAIAVATALSVNVKSNDSGLSDLGVKNTEALATMSCGQGTLYGNASETSFCCCPGSNSCGAASCSGCPS